MDNEQKQPADAVGSSEGLGLGSEAIGHLHSNGDFCQERAVDAPVWWPVAMFSEDQLRAAVAAERERCAKVCEEIGALEALDGEDEGSAALVRVADRMADLCAAAIRKA